MRIEIIRGRYLLCGTILSEEFILPGQKWARADGSDIEVKVIMVHDGLVSYTDKESGYNSQSTFDFQTRYCLVLDRAEEYLSFKGTNQCASSLRYAALQH